MPNPKIRTRFAPSPTGYMHVGNLRTCLLYTSVHRAEHRHRAGAALRGCPLPQQTLPVEPCLHRGTGERPRLRPAGRPHHRGPQPGAFAGSVGQPLPLSLIHIGLKERADIGIALRTFQIVRPHPHDAPVEGYLIVEGLVCLMIDLGKVCSAFLVDGCLLYTSSRGASSAS